MAKEMVQTVLTYLPIFCLATGFTNSKIRYVVSIPLAGST